MFQSDLLKNKDKVIEKIKKNQPIIILISLSIVISNLSKLTESNSSEISLITLFSVAASIYFFIALIGSILTDVNKGLLFVLTFYFGLGFGFLFLFLIIIFLILTFLPSIYTHLLIFLILITTFIAVTISGLKLCISYIKAGNKVSLKRKSIAIIFEISHFLGLIMYTIGHSFLILNLLFTDDFHSIYLCFIVYSVPIIIVSNSLIALTLKMK